MGIGSPPTEKLARESPFFFFFSYFLFFLFPFFLFCFVLFRETAPVNYTAAGA